MQAYIFKYLFLNWLDLVARVRWMCMLNPQNNTSKRNETALQELIGHVFSSPSVKLSTCMESCCWLLTKKLKEKSERGCLFPIIDTGALVTHIPTHPHDTLFVTHLLSALQSPVSQWACFQWGWVTYLTHQKVNSCVSLSWHKSVHYTQRDAVYP